MEWTKKQKEAIEKYYDSNLLVSAAAGSGKTAVLVERILNLIIQKNASLENMLIVTFTKAAATGMKEKIRGRLKAYLSSCDDEEVKNRISNELSILPKSLICTFDSFASYVVKNYYHIIGVNPSFAVCDKYKGSILKNEALDEVFSKHYEKGDEDFIFFLDSYSDGKSDSDIRDLILSLCDYAVNLNDPNSFLENLGFDPENLFNAYIKELKYKLAKAKEYLVCLCDFAKMNKMSKTLLISSGEVNKIDSIIGSINMGNVAAAVEELKNYQFERLSVGKEEKIIKDANISFISSLWDDGAKKIISKEFKEEISLLSLNQFYDEKERLKKPLCVLSSLCLEFADSYSKKKQDASLLDFIDIEHFAIEILKNENVRKEFRSKFDYIFVDEYQDSNLVQEEILKSVSRDNIFMVGDVKQSIYKFRHAEPELFIQKYNQYKKEGNGHVIDLNNNFRSKKGIIDFVNALFENLMNDKDSIVYDDAAKLYMGKEYDLKYSYDPTLMLIEKSDEDFLDPEIERIKKDEALAIVCAETIKEYKGNKEYIDENGETKTLDYKDMVVLLRSSKVKGEIYYEALSKAGIPVFLERSEGYFDTPEIAVFVNLLKILDNFNSDIPLISVLHFKTFGFSSEELAKIRLFAIENGKKYISYSEAFKYYMENATTSLSKKCSNFYEKIKAWNVKSKAGSLADFLWDLLNESKILLFASSLPYGNQRVSNLRALVDKADAFEQETKGNLFEFVSYLENISEDDKVSVGQSRIISEGENVVRIMTIHKSKGLEFPFVFLASMDSVHKDSKSQFCVFHKEYGTSIHLKNEGNNIYAKPLSFNFIQEKKAREEGLEDLRTLYTALTRARDFLVMSGFCKNASELREKKESLRIKGNSLSSYLEMVYPYVKNSSIKLRNMSGINSDMYKAAEDKSSSFRNNLKNGFELDKSLLSISEEEIEKRLSYDYGNKEGKNLKKKYSVTELVNSNDKESYDEQIIPKFISSKESFNSARLGTLYHLVMENIPFVKEAKDIDFVSAYIEELVKKGKMSKEEALAISPKNIVAFFNSRIGEKLISSSNVHRETPFVMKKMYNDEELLVQGTIDLWFTFEDKLILLDYKSNYIDKNRIEAEIERIKQQYEKQILLYKEALELNHNTVDECYLYLFSIGEFVKI